MRFRSEKQLAEALGPVNRWYCSQAYGRRIDDPETLVTYYIKSRGAENFALRFEQAMGPVNRWYCSQCHSREVNDPETLWNHYMSYRDAGSRNDDKRNQRGEVSGDYGIAC